MISLSSAASPSKLAAFVAKIIIADGVRVVLFGMKHAEDAIDLAEVARQRQYFIAVLREPWPLSAILDRRVPQEWRAHRCISLRDVVLDDVIVLGRADVETGDAVENHADGVKPAFAPRPILARLG